MDDLVTYDRQSALDSALGFNKKRLNIIIGCGGVGFWTGLMLALNGFESFILIDGQKLEPSNLNRIPVPQTWVGTNKTVALRKMIRFMRPLTATACITTHITVDTLGMLKDLIQKDRRNSEGVVVWDATDDARIQVAINKTVLALNKTVGTVGYRKIGYEGFEVGNYSNYDVWFDEETYRPGYRTSNANAITSVIAAGLGIFSAHMTEKDVNVNLKTLIEKGGTTNVQVQRERPARRRVAHRNNA